MPEKNLFHVFIVFLHFWGFIKNDLVSTKCLGTSQFSDFWEIYKFFFYFPDHRCTQGRGGGYETAPPRQIFEKLVNKNAIKPKIGGPPAAIFPKTLDPP